VRRTLTAESHPRHALAPLLLCPTADAACGADTAGWEMRARAAFERFAEVRLEDRRQDRDDPPRTEASCANAAYAAAVDERYDVWRECIAQVPMRTEALPLGRFRAPTRGWFVVRGRRGHYDFCDEIGAYHLGTGSAYIARSCTALALAAGGAVDQRATDGARRDAVVTGLLPVDNLREAAWMILLAAEVQEEVLEQEAMFDVPPGIVPRRSSAGVATYSASGGSWSHSSAQTQLAWSYIVDGRSVAAGELTWPNDFDSAALDHAVRLLAIAEAGLRGACPAVALPAPLDLGGARPGVSRVDAPPDRVTAVDRQLLRRLAGARPGRAGCRPPPEPPARPSQGRR
jgi:hypothetical protein